MAYDRCVHQFTLDFRRPTINRLQIVDGDTANTFEITLKDRGNAVTLDATLHKVIAVFTRADGEVYAQDEDTDVVFTADGVVTIDVYPSSFRTGVNNVKVQLYKRTSSSEPDYPALLTTYEQPFQARSRAVPESGATPSAPQMPMLEKYVQDAKSWARGETGTREGENVDNAKFYADIAKALYEGTVVEPSILDWMDTHPDEALDYIGEWLDDHPEATTTVEDGAITPVKLNEAVGGLVEVPSAWTSINANASNPDPSLTVLNGYIRPSTGSSPGKITATDSYRCYYFQADEDMYVYATCSATSQKLRVSNEQPVTGTGSGTAWTGSLYDTMPSKNEAVAVLKNQYVAVSTRSDGLIVIYKRPKVSVFGLNADVPLTDSMTATVDAMIKDAADTAVSSDALLYVDKIPSYWVQPKDTPTTYDEARPYLENKIAQIPDGRSFLFITDVHWLGNEKHSTQLMQYIRKRTGIKPVLHAGDIYGQANTQYLATKVLGSYLYECRQAFREDFIPCVGDHDNNTVSQPDEVFVPYVQLAPMFVNDLRNRAVIYEPSEKVAAMVESEADYNEIMAFFRTVYYVDDKSTKTRIIVLNCGNAGTTGAVYDAFGTMGTEMVRTQIPFLIDALYSTPIGYDVCVLSHKLSYSSSSTNATLHLLSDFKIKKPNSKPAPASSTAAIEEWWDHGTQYDFSDAPDIGLLYVLDGHQHIDKLTWAGYDSLSAWSRANQYNGEELDQREYGQIPCITTQTDSASNREAGTAEMTPGTTTEQAFDVVTRVTDGIVLTRIGAGSNRRVYAT